MWSEISQRWGLTSREGSLLVQLLLLAVTILTYSVIAMAIANSLFVNNVGAHSLPIAFIAIGLASIPAYGLFSTAIDRYPRADLFRFVLLLSGVLAIALRFLLHLDSSLVYYGLLIVVFFQWDFYNNILYPSLAMDYFTALEYKRYAPFIGIAQGVGTMVGGGITILLSHFLATADLLWLLPIALGMAVGQVTYLEKSQPKRDLIKPAQKNSLLASIKSFPNLVEQYPLVGLLAASSFLLVIVYLSSEFLWFSIYGNSFNEEQLTAFLGKMRIVISLVQIAVLYGVTRPLLQKFGVAKLNGVYPITTLLSFVGLGLSFKLPSAIALQVNGDAFYKGINLPIHQLNYNAIPPEFRGRVRALSDGSIYAAGLTLAGGILFVAERYLTLTQITAIAGFVTLLLLLVRIPMGKYYAQGLEQTIQRDTVDLDALAETKISLSPQFQETIAAMLLGDFSEGQLDRGMQLRGLELAGSLGKLSQFVPQISQLIVNADDELKTTLVELLVKDPQAEKIYQQLWEHPQEAVATVAWELGINCGIATALVTSGGKGHNKELVEYDSVTSLAAVQPHTMQPQQQKSLIRAIALCQQPAAVPLLTQIAQQDSWELKYFALRALGNFIAEEGLDIALVASSQIELLLPVETEDPYYWKCLTAAWTIIEQTHYPEVFEILKTGLEQTKAPLINPIANAIAAYGTAGLNLARTSLTANNPNTVKTAIAALGKIGTKQGVNALYSYLQPQFAELDKTDRWQQQIPTQDDTWQPLSIALADFQQRQIQQVLYILACLGRSRTVKTIEQILASNNSTDIANAVEVLSSLQQRRFVAPLIPILEQRLKPKTIPGKKASWLATEGYGILTEALASRDRWIKSAALTVLATIPRRAITDDDPVVKAVCQRLFAQPTSQNTIMNRLLLLKSVSLFKNLTLDELFAIEQALISEQVLAQQVIYTEASWGSHFYLVAEGTVKLTKQVQQEAKEIKQVTTGEYFGEIALFDDAPRWDSAIAVTNCTLLKLEKKQFLSIISQRPHIILEICRFLSKRLRETDKYLTAKID